MIPQSEPTTRTARPHLLAWRWLYLGIALFIGATVLALLQQPRPVPPHREKLPLAFLAPVESNPHRRLPTVPDNLNGVYFAADGQRGWAVGDRGRIVATTDGGSTWRQQESNVTQHLLEVIFEKDGLHGWAGWSGGAVVATSDGGQRWQATDEHWEDIRKRGNLETRFGTLFRAPELSGAAAVPGSAEMRAALMRIANRSSPVTGRRHQNMITGDGTIVVTINGGAPASTLGNMGHSFMTAGHIAAGGLRAWVVGNTGSIMATSDGGKTWHPQTSTAQPPLYDLWVDPDGTRAWAVGDLGIVLASSDGGQSWVPQDSGTRQPLFAVTFQQGGLYGWAGGENGTIVATVNGGKMWTPQTTNTNLSITALSFSPDGASGWATDRDGKKLVTTDGGRTWTAPTSRGESDDTLGAVGFTSDGRLGWAVRKSAELTRDGGRLLKSIDGGKNWTYWNDSAQRMTAVSFDKEGRHGVAISGIDLVENKLTFSGRDLLVTDDGAATWQPQPALRDLPLQTVKLAGNGQRGLGLAMGSQIMATDDGGRHWRQAEHYAWRPAPWYWLAVLLSAALAWLSWHWRPAGSARVSVADVAASDSEVREPADDRLNFGGLARGISRFLRNTETQPPLTLAITGDWGSGKSSLMRLVCADLRRFGHRPIWFNAWHHQKEEHLFAALLGAIHAQAVPPLFSLSGVTFRLRLLWLRSRHHFGAMMLVVALVSALALFSLEAFQSGGLNNVTLAVDALRKMTVPPLEALIALSPTLSALFAAATALIALAKGTKAFGVNPALLLGAARERMSLKAATAQNDFRDQFARQFDELTMALPYRLVIIVDDLDRCRPSSVIEVMEAVNYLTSAGKCFVIFGMATERVTAALGLAFKDIAAEMVQMEGGVDNGGEQPPSDALRELAKRRAYATDYLQKLVNIEVKVPSAQDQAYHRLLLSAEPEPRRRTTQFSRAAARLWPLAALCVAMLCGSWISKQAGQLLSQERRAPPAASASPAGGGQAAPASAAPALAPGATAAVAPPSHREARAVVPGETASAASKMGWIALAVALLLVIAGPVALPLLRKTLYQTRDSEQFKEALEIWTTVVASKRNTPRSIKRFGNRLRYLAMLQQGEEQDKTVFDDLWRQLRRRRGDGGDSAPAPAADALREHQLIALGALQEVCGAEWQERMADIFYPHWSTLSENPRDDPQVRALKKAARAHMNKFQVAWPPRPEEIKVFERLIAGVRLAGDPRIVSPAAAAAESSAAEASSTTSVYQERSAPVE